MGNFYTASQEPCTEFALILLYHALVRAQGPLATWVVKECAGVLLQHLLLGFELGVYAPHEHCMLFW